MATTRDLFVLGGCQQEQELRLPQIVVGGEAGEGEAEEGAGEALDLEM